MGHGNIGTTMNNYVDAKPSNQQLDEINALVKQL